MGYRLYLLFIIKRSAITKFIRVMESARLNVSFNNVLTSDKYFLQKLNYIFFSSGLIFLLYIV